MSRSAFRFPILAVLFTLSLLFSSLPSALAQGGPTIGVEPQTVSVTVGSTFTVDVWIRNVRDHGGLVWFDFNVTWDPKSVQYISRTNHVARNNVNWEVLKDEIVVTSDLGSHRLQAGDPTRSQWPQNLYSFYDDASWVTLTFRCLASGDTFIEFPITFDSSRWGYWSDGSDSYSFDEYFNGIVHQTIAVGGTVMTVNKLEILSPYLALLGLVGALTVAAAATRRRKP